ncbi:hypothetical protein [Methanosarcina barkeri]|nr:hypothetical protein [Methanosarcina barkeri]
MAFFRKREFKEINPYEIEIGFDGKPLHQQKQETNLMLCVGF